LIEESIKDANEVEEESVPVTEGSVYENITSIRSERKFVQELPSDNDCFEYDNIDVLCLT